MRKSNIQIKIHANLQDLLVRTNRTNNNCIEWQGARSAAGYGQVRLNSKTQYVHRLVCELIRGKSPADKSHVLHSCDNPPCVNPDHLSWGSAKDNALDKVAKGRARNKAFYGEENTASKLTEIQVREIRNKVNNGVARKLIADEYGITVGHIKQIRSGRCWGWLE